MPWCFLTCAVFTVHVSPLCSSCPHRPRFLLTLPFIIFLLLLFKTMQFVFPHFSALSAPNVLTFLYYGMKSTSYPYKQFVLLYLFLSCFHHTKNKIEQYVQIWSDVSDVCLSFKYQVTDTLRAHFGQLFRFVGFFFFLFFFLFILDTFWFLLLFCWPKFSVTDTRPFVQAGWIRETKPWTPQESWWDIHVHALWHAQVQWGRPSSVLRCRLQCVLMQQQASELEELHVQLIPAFSTVGPSGSCACKSSASKNFSCFQLSCTLPAAQMNQNTDEHFPVNRSNLLLPKKECKHQATYYVHTNSLCSCWCMLPVKSVADKKQ